MVCNVTTTDIKVRGKWSATLREMVKTELYSISWIFGCYQEIQRQQVSINILGFQKATFENKTSEEQLIRTVGKAIMVVLRLLSCLIVATVAICTAAGLTRASSQHAAHRSLNGSYPRYRVSPLDGSTIALPSQDQLNLQDKEMGILIHFNIATYISIDGCNGVPGLVPAPDIFDPTIINTDQWMDSITASGAKYATLVAKHNCGFTTWPSTVTFETRDKITHIYNYTVADSPVNGTDVVKMFSDSAEKYAVGHGFYYSTIVNNFLNVQNSLVNTTWSPGEIRITNETYDEIVIAQLTELWANYGTLTEVSR